MELRFHEGSELRAEGKRLTGVAAPYGHLAQVCDFYETIDPGAFTRSLRQKADVRALYNHDPSKIGGRTKNGTLSLESRGDGLHFQVELPDTELGHDLHALVNRGDTDACSFGFSCPDGGDSWAQRTIDGKVRRVRTLKDVDLHDISAVTYPAYLEGTSVSARSIYGSGGGRIQPSSVGIYSGAGCDVERARLNLMVRLAMHV
jgi:uncharacterized protein